MKHLLVTVYEQQAVSFNGIIVIQRTRIPSMSRTLYIRFPNSRSHTEVLADIIESQLLTTGTPDCLAHPVDITHHTWNVFRKLGRFVDKFDKQNVRFILQAATGVRITMIEQLLHVVFLCTDSFLVVYKCIFRIIFGQTGICCITHFRPL